jgi:nucleoside phosphorylase
VDAASGPIVVLTALDLEYQAVRAYLTELRRFSHPTGTVFETGWLGAGPAEIVIAVTGAGNPGAAVLAERAIAMFEPRALLFVGVAGTLKNDVDLGDVVVATKVYGYHGGKAEDDGFMARPRAWDAPHELDQLARVIARTRSWSHYLALGPEEHVPRVHFAPVAAGEVLLNSRVTPLAEQLRRSYNDAAAIEMESAGISQAGHLNRDLPTLTIRGISDRADGAKHDADQAGWQPTAARHAAAFALALAADLIAQSPGVLDAASEERRRHHARIRGEREPVRDGGMGREGLRRSAEADDKFASEIVVQNVNADVSIVGKADIENLNVGRHE